MPREVSWGSRKGQWASWPWCRTQVWLILASPVALWLVGTPPGPFSKPLSASVCSRVVSTTCKLRYGPALSRFPIIQTMPLGKSVTGPLPKDASLLHSGNHPPLPMGQNESAWTMLLRRTKPVAGPSSLRLVCGPAGLWQTNSASFPDVTHLPLKFSCLNSFTD